jgi:hypothetical protein
MQKQKEILKELNIRKIIIEAEIDTLIYNYRNINRKKYKKLCHAINRLLNEKWIELKAINKRIFLLKTHIAIVKTIKKGVI